MVIKVAERNWENNRDELGMALRGRLIYKQLVKSCTSWAAGMSLVQDSQSRRFLISNQLFFLAPQSVFCQPGPLLRLLKLLLGLPELGQVEGGDLLGLLDLLLVGLDLGLQLTS